MTSLWILLCLLPAIQQISAWKNWKRPACDPVKCDPNCREVSSPKGCPTCFCETAPRCSMPVCGPGCKVQTEFKGHCPGCDCEEVDIGIGDVKSELKKLCSPPLCPPGCEIETDFTGPCPGCKCERGGGKEEEEGGFKGIIDKPLCSPPLCPPGCEIETEFFGPCPGCKCDRGGKDEGDILEIGKPKCSPPLCPPGCEIEIDFTGPCPGCKCDKGGKIDVDLRKPMCAPVKCGPTCREALGLNGCPTCLCDPICSPPKCPPGCVIEKAIDEPCPGCKCVKEEVVIDDLKKECPPEEECKGPCEPEIDESGCKKCVCKPVCDPPRCMPDCFLKQQPGLPCPTCYCPKKKWSWKH